MNFTPKTRAAGRAVIALFAAVASLALASPYAHSIVGDAKNWTAQKWSGADIALFHGAPIYHGPAKHLILLRYTFFVSLYDLDRHVPMWVAHVDEQESLAKDEVRKGGHWDRSTDHFIPDENVVSGTTNLFGHFEDRRQMTDDRPLPTSPSFQTPWPVSYGPSSVVRPPSSITLWVTNESYTNANPIELPIDPSGYRRLTRGHLASNQEMKSLGTDAEGEISQTESFSLANVVPQMQHHNAPLWSTLETDCLRWAALLGRIAIISGPVYAPDAAQPPPVNRILTTDGNDHVPISIPTHFFKIIIGQINSRAAAVGFLIPHRADLEKEDLRKFVVPIGEIERITRLNFMPGLGKNKVLESTGDMRWLKLLP